MRRICSLLLVLVLVGLVPSAALAARPSFAVSSITVVGAGEYTDYCSVKVTVTWTAMNRIKAVKFLQSWGTNTSQPTLTILRGSSTTNQYFNAVNLETNSVKWGAVLIGGGGKLLTSTVWTPVETWTDSECPIVDEQLASYTAPTS